MIDKLVHSCIIPSGPMEGVTHEEIIHGYHLTAGTQCTVCGENLADIDEMVAHLYEEATK